MDEKREKFDWTFIPAQPGWYLAICCSTYSEASERETGEVYLHPIIAWRIESFATAGRPRATDNFHVVRSLGYPVTTEGEAENDENTMIKAPDGLYYSPFYSPLTEAEAQVAMKEMWAEGQETRKKARGG